MLTTPKFRFASRVDLARIALGWGGFGVLLIGGPLFVSPVPLPFLIASLSAIIAIITVCAFGVVKQAEALARRLGDPYGSLVLTLSIVLIDVILIAAVLLGPGQNATIARDSVMAVAMIILNLVIGLSLMLGGMRNGSMRHNRLGTSAYLTMLIVLTTLAFALPALIGEDGTYTPGQAIPVIALTLGLYGFFLYRQLGPQATDFQENSYATRQKSTRDSGGNSISIKKIIHTNRSEITMRLLLLTATVTPIVLLSHDMAALLHDGLNQLKSPLSLAGVLIAMIVFLPESLTAFRAALSGQAQRVSNLCHGALVSTVGLTIPVVLLIGILADQPVFLAETPTNLALLAATMLLSSITFTSPKSTATHGATHLALFAVYAITLFN